MNLGLILIISIVIAYLIYVVILYRGGLKMDPFQDIKENIYIIPTPVVPKKPSPAVNSNGGLLMIGQ
jgi:hypothetical protein